MSNVGRIVKWGESSAAVTGITSSYVVAKAQKISMNTAKDPNGVTQPLRGELLSLYCELSSVDATISQVSVSVFKDSDCDYQVLPEAALTINKGQTTSTIGTLTAKIDFPLRNRETGGTAPEEYYLLYKTDAPAAETIDVDYAEIGWLK